MNDRPVPKWVWASLVLTALASLLTIVPRFMAERENRAVGLAMEAENIRQLGLADGKSYAESLAYLADHGLTAVVMSDDVLGDEVGLGGMQVREQGGSTTVVCPDAESASRVLGAARARFHTGSAAPGQAVVLQSVDPTALKSLSIGIDPDAAAKVRGAGLKIIARHANLPGINGEYLDYLLATSRERGAVGYLPVGDSVLGYRGLSLHLGDKLKELGMQYCAPEFAKIAGDSKMVEKFPDITVRLHTAQQAETNLLSPGAVVERYAKAYKERGMRWLLLRPTTLASPQPLRDAALMLNDIKKALVKEGGQVRAPRPFTEPKTDRLAFVLVGLFAAPFVAYTGSRLLSPKLLVPFLVLAALAGAACYVEAGRPYVALAAATTAPLLGFLWLSKSEAPWWRLYLVVSAVTLVGGLVVASQLVGLKYMVQAEQFTGIKVAVFLPVLAVGALLADQVFGVKEIFGQPVKWGTLVTGLVFLAAMAFMISRTGNDNPAGVSGLELKLRSMLDFIFSTRPRTKEFAVGHPAMVLGLMLWTRRKELPGLQGWAAMLLTVGAVGQTSVVNTLCHAHSPVQLALQRIVTGHVLGCILGLCLWGAASRFIKRPAKSA
ncbi:MAG: hypothetical protein KF857_04660 [Fimbriimonadaceae bacterium]|nr:hypothetical protein [Fimbriimonadaceae bacterium]